MAVLGLKSKKFLQLYAGRKNGTTNDRELHAVRAKGKWRKNIINVELGLLNLIADIGARKAIMGFQSP